MSTLQEYVLVIGSFQGFLLAGLLIFDSRLSTASRVLGFLCLLMAAVFLLPFVLLAEAGPLLRLSGWMFYVPAAGGALAYLYCRSALLDQSLRVRDMVLFLPWVGCYLLTADVFLSDPQEMVRWITGGAPRTWRLQASEYLIFAQAYGFAALTVSMIWRYRRQANDLLSNFNPTIFRWLLTLQVFTIVIWTLKALPALTPAPVVLSHAADVTMVALIYVIAITQWRHPQLFKIPSLARERDTRSPRAGTGELDPAMRATLYGAIEAAVESERLYLDSGLTLSGLAEAAGLSRHQVSEVLNRHAGKNFYEFINGYRVAAACERLKLDRTARVLDVALDAGFSSKSTFNAIFRQFTGRTPTQYRRSPDSTDV